MYRLSAPRAPSDDACFLSLARLSSVKDARDIQLFPAAFLPLLLPDLRLRVARGVVMRETHRREDGIPVRDVCTSTRYCRLSTFQHCRIFHSFCTFYTFISQQTDGRTDGQSVAHASRLYPCNKSETLTLRLRQSTFFYDTRYLNSVASINAG